ncbi:MAG: FtsH protease activity modulator HflK [Pseudoprimorskyibacter sp.]|nr:FtsH protease activity modulator HflK [Pseudoprimorskyibacter sp.]
MAGNNGGPWGGGGGDGGNRSGQNGGGNNGGGRGPGQDPNQIPEIDELVKKGQERLKGIIGGRGGAGGPGGAGGSGPGLPNRLIILIALVAVVITWLFSSFYRVQNFEQSVELFLGRYVGTRDEGLRFAPWPLETREIVAVTSERTVDIGVASSSSRRSEQGLMLTGDENIVDIDFQVVWNINDPAQYLFNLAEPELTISAVSESAMREIIAQSELAPILNRDRESIATRLKELIQSTLDSYDSGVNIVRVNFTRADPPDQVIDEFLAVQSAEQQRDRLEKEADAYANRVVAAARGEGAQVLEEAEAYRAQVVNEAEGEAARFTSVLTEYSKAPDVTRTRLYLETMEKVLGRIDKVIIEGGVGGDGGIVPYLPLNELRKGSN